MYFYEKRANQVICTGISQIILGSCVFALSFILSDSKHGSVFEIGVAYWGGVPTVIAGILGISGGFIGNFMLNCLFLAVSVISCCLGGVIATCVGIKLSAKRAVGECKHVYCPYDSDSIMMIALISVSILQAALSLSGVVESSQILCCYVSDRNRMSMLVSGESSPTDVSTDIRLERVEIKRPLTDNGFFSTDYSAKLDRLPLAEFGFKRERQSFRVVELSTIV